MELKKILKLVGSDFMDKLQESLKKESIEDLFETYKNIEKLINELNSSIKELPPKEEL